MSATVEGVGLNSYILLLATIQHQTPFGEFEHIVSERDFPLISELMKRAETISNGTLVEHDAMFDPAGEMRWVKPAQAIPFKNVENMFKVRVHWAISNQNMHFEEREINAKRAGKKGKEAARVIQDFYKARRQANIVMPWNKQWEAGMLNVPTNADDDTTPVGYPGWVCLAPSGFTGIDWRGESIRYADGSTSTTIGGIRTDDVRTRGLWKNLTGTVAKWGDKACLDVMLEFYKRGRFKKPPKTTNVNASQPDDTIILVGTDVWLDMAKLAQVCMDQKRGDLTLVDGVLRYMGIEIQDVPNMDYNASHPLWKYRPMYWIDRRSYKILKMEGEFMRESEPMRISAERHRSYGIQVDTQAAAICFNRRQQGVIHLPIP